MGSERAKRSHLGGNEDRRKGRPVGRLSRIHLLMVGVGLAFTLFVIIDFLLDSEAFFVQIPPVVVVTEIVIVAFCLFVLPLLALFPRTIGLSARGFFVASFIFGLGVWFYGLLVGYRAWENGVTALKGHGEIAVSMLLGLTLVYLSRSAGQFLAKKAAILSSESMWD